MPYRTPYDRDGKPETFAVFEGIQMGNRFISSVNGRTDEELTKLANGKVAYRVLYKADTIPECQRWLFGDQHEKVNFDKKEHKRVLDILDFFVVSPPLFELREKIRASQNVELDKAEKIVLAAAIKTYIDTIMPDNDENALIRMELNNLYFQLIL